MGSGSTADAVRREVATGAPTKGCFHSIKGEQCKTFLQKWLDNNSAASPGDRAIAENVLLDLKDSLGERMWFSQTTVPK